MADSAHVAMALCMGGIGLATGFVMHRSDFCMAAAFRDPFLFRSWFSLRIVGLCVLLTALLYEALSWSGLVRAFIGGPPLWGNLLGGALFGVGMVLAGGCVVGTLYRAGTGNLVSWTALAGIVAGSALYAEVHPVVAPWATRPVGIGAATLPEWLGLPPRWGAWPFLLAGALLYARWARRGLLSRQGFARGYLPPWKAAAFFSLATAAAVALTGMPLGITTFYAKTAAWLEALALPGHVDGLAYFAASPFRLTTPFGVALAGGPGPRLDSLAWLQGPTVLGILAGSFVSAASLGEFRLFRRAPSRQLALALAGGVLLAFGSRVGLGCNVWFILGWLPALKLQGVFFLAGLLPGAWLGAKGLERALA